MQQLKPIADEAGLSMAQLAVAWVLQNDNVAAAIIGASRPEQVHENVKAAGVKLDADLLAKIDEVLDPVVERDPAKTTRKLAEDPRGVTAALSPLCCKRRIWSQPLPVARHARSSASADRWKRRAGGGGAQYRSCKRQRPECHVALGLN